MKFLNLDVIKNPDQLFKLLYHKTSNRNRRKIEIYRERRYHNKNMKF